jgi:hypothetical protein
MDVLPLLMHRIESAYALHDELLMSIPDEQACKGLIKELYRPFLEPQPLDKVDIGAHLKNIRVEAAKLVQK